MAPVPMHTRQMLTAIRCQREDDWGSLLTEVYADLRRLAECLMRRQRPSHTLQPTALVHEAWLRLSRRKQKFPTQADLLAWCATVMKNILIDHARGQWPHYRLASEEPGSDSVETLLTPEILALHDCLEKLADSGEKGARMREVVTLRFFGGLTEKEIAKVLKTSLATVERDWNFARAWLRQEIEKRVS